MSSAFWLLLYLAPLLGLTAAVFAWLGWHWRGSGLRQRLKELETQIDDAQNALRRAETESETARNNVIKIAAEADTLREQTEDELRTLRADLHAAQAAARQSQDAAAKSHEAALALETAGAKTLRDLDLLRRERDQATTALKAAQAELEQLRARPANQATDPVPVPEESPTPPIKPKRKRATPTKSKPAAAPVTLRNKITTLVNDLSQHQSTISALTQERDGWQRQVAKLEEKNPADAAGIGLARRSLADSEQRLQTASDEIDRLENQARAMHQAREKATALAGVPDDDLTQIKGIKKVINEQLRACGIRTWKQIAQWDDAELRAFSELLAFKNRATREQWQEQARALHEAAHGPL